MCSVGKKLYNYLYILFFIDWILMGSTLQSSRGCSPCQERVSVKYRDQDRETGGKTSICMYIHLIIYIYTFVNKYIYIYVYDICWIRGFAQAARVLTYSFFEFHIGENMKTSPQTPNFCFRNCYPQTWETLRTRKVRAMQCCCFYPP